MNYLHYEVELGPEDVVNITLDKQANVLMMNDTNYNLYKFGKKYRYYGGLAKTSPVQLKPPSPGHWHVVIDLGGYSGTVRAGVSIENAVAG